MSPRVLFVAIAILCAALGCGLIAGVFFAFSTFVMPALARLPPAQGIAAMQSINVVVLNRWFLGVFMGTAAISAVIAVVAIVTWSKPGAAFLLGASALYCGGTILVTRAFNIPLNDALAAVKPDSVEGAELWQRYVADWTTWNHVRGAAALAAAALFTLALLYRGRMFLSVGAFFALTGCGPFQNYRTCNEPPAARLSQAPATLSGTGLFSEMRTRTLADGVVPYRPRFELWSDGATKQRWVQLPHGAKIDTTDMDGWQFPIGTKLWKEFTRDGVLVETRFLHKVGDAADDWLSLSYVWNEDGTDALATPAGRSDARGTAHDVPPARQCMGCHGGTASRVLGFSAIQLASDDHVARTNEMTLARLEKEHRISRAPPRSLRVPGDATEQAALGYLHANCSHCHNAHRPQQSGARCFDPRQDFDLSLRSGELASTSSTAVYRTAIGRIITKGDPTGSALVERFQKEGVFEARMPALGTERTNADASELLRRWIQGLH